MNESGTYAVFDGRQLVYIGSALHLRARLLEHGIGRRWSTRIGRFSQANRYTVKIAYNRTGYQHLTREARLIQRLRPRLNSTHRPRFTEGTNA